MLMTVDGGLVRLSESEGRRVMVMITVRLPSVLTVPSIRHPVGLCRTNVRVSPCLYRARGVVGRDDFGHVPQMGDVRSLRFRVMCFLHRSLLSTVCAILEQAMLPNDRHMQALHLQSGCQRHRCSNL